MKNRVLSAVVSLVVLFGCDNVESSVKELSETSQQSNNEDGGERDADLEAYSESADTTATEQFEASDEDDLPTQHLTQYYGNGPTVKRRFSLVNNKLNGVVYDYHRNGRVELKSEYNEGTPIGEWIYYSYDGDKEKEQEYYGNGKIKTEINYDYNGEVKSKIKLGWEGNIAEYFEKNPKYLGMDGEDLAGTGEGGLLSGTALSHCTQCVLGIPGVRELTAESAEKLDQLKRAVSDTHPDNPVKYIRFRFSNASVEGRQLNLMSADINAVDYYSSSNELLSSR
ncbi:toxin-antitoxin system YwqK family antitoxin [Hymenobacter endophyticus]|uniref:Toxin-antitoxin system YwqK family antitoxin n=1 Tax=Hymenobacter endophyticus TaxID=3076335 RepID=A0ABU3TCJ6_9BACT|nr:hypothetical protein [Hymenobacter endophyticus]MDU0369088.1 hypothetical protein [Hymenobacter endophyticus]